MATQATVADFYKTSTTPGTPVALGSSSLKFSSLRLLGYKAAGVPNAGNVKWRFAGSTGWSTIATETGDDLSALIKPGSFLKASQIEIDVATSGDGVYAIYTSSVVYEGD